MKTTPKLITFLLAIVSIAIGIFTNIATDVIPDSLKFLSQFSWLALGILIVLYLTLVWLSAKDEQAKNKNISQLAKREIDKATLQTYKSNLKKAVLNIWVSKFQIKDIISILSRISLITETTFNNLLREIIIVVEESRVEKLVEIEIGKTRKQVETIIETTKKFHNAKMEINRESQAGNISPEVAEIAISNLDKELDEKLNAITT